MTKMVSLCVVMTYKKGNGIAECHANYSSKSEQRNNRGSLQSGLEDIIQKYMKNQNHSTIRVLLVLHIYDISFPIGPEYKITKNSFNTPQWIEKKMVKLDGVEMWGS